MDRLIESLEWSLKMIREHDNVLLKNKVREESINHRLAVYLETRLKDFSDGPHSVDIEYDKHIDDKKENLNGDEFRPDLTIHKRKSDDFNFLYVEAKKMAGPRGKKIDEIKIRGAMEFPLNYKYGARVQYGNGLNGMEFEIFYRDAAMEIQSRLIVVSE